MARASPVFVCNACSGETLKWQGQCPLCGEWNSLEQRAASPRHAARLQSSWRLPRDLGVDLSLRWLDHLPAQNVPAYTALDARVSWLVVPRLDLAVVGHDLLRPRHLEFGGGGTNPIEIQRSVYGEARLRW